MIKVRFMPEPQNFDQKVRAPGSQYLRSVPVGKQPDFRRHEYWRRVLYDLYQSYRGICAYTCHWIPPDTGSDTVEHFVPKRIDPAQAYEWSNYRLVCQRLNARKREFQDVADPFKVTSSMFAIHFPSLQLIVGKGLSRKETALVKSTIKRLKLNDTRCVQARQEWLTTYMGGGFNLLGFKKKAPLLAREINRQKLSKAKLRKIMKPR